jgi:DNA-directed RNA polymerase subunit M
MFCDDCGTLLQPDENGGGKVCPDCGSASESDDSEDVVVKSAAREEEVAVIEESGAGLPKTEDEECPECGHRGCYYYERQMRAADEAQTRFYICEECDNRWRDYN